LRSGEANNDPGPIRDAYLGGRNPVNAPDGCRSERLEHGR
jgi:hypothetical protein